MSKTITIAIIVFAVLAAALIFWIAWSNKALELNKYTVSNTNLPKEFSGFRIAHISDLHNAEMGKNNEKLLLMLCEAEPDIIAVTGDMIDSRNTDIDVALRFAAEAVKIAPCYYVSGNHEARINEYETFKDGLTEIGVSVLSDEKVRIEKSGERIMLVGVNDSRFDTDYLFGDSVAVMKRKLNGLLNEKDKYTILLSHRPELFEVYAENNLNLVLSGHAHGGQFRLPFVGGLFAPNQGLFPKYDSGLYEKEDTAMIVSRGIGKSIIPFRINNRPEVILIELQNE